MPPTSEDGAREKRSAPAVASDAPAAAPQHDADTFHLSQSPSHLLRRAAQYAGEIFARAGIEDAVTLRQTIVLAAIGEAEGCSQADLVVATGIDRSTLAEMVARMERRKLIERAPAQKDMRAKAVRLTALGRMRLADAIPAIRQADEKLLEALPRTRRGPFATALGVLAAAGAAAAEADIARARQDKADARAAKSMDKARRKQRKKRKKKKR